VIGQILPRGSSVRGLLYYLFTEGRAGEKGLEAEHRDPRVIASWDGQPAGLQPPLCGGRRDFTDIVNRLNEPLGLLGFSKAELKAVKPVYHLTIAAAKDPSTGQLVDRQLSDAQWADIAGEYLHRLGLARRGDADGVRWVAVRHAEDHVHVVATLARQDGKRPRLSNDRYRSREASRFVEDKYRLTPTSAASRTGSAPTSRAEQRKHQQAAQRRRHAGRPAPTAPDREVLRRHVRTAAAGADDLESFFARLRADGLLVRQRMSERNPGEVTGYAVALPGRDDEAGDPIWFGGGKLAPDLTLPRLQRRWHGPGAGRSGPVSGPDGRAGRSAGGGDARGGSAGRDRFGLTDLQRRQVWVGAVLAARTASEHISASAAADPNLAADAAWAASDFLAAAARVAEGRAGGPLTDAAGMYDAAARELFGRPVAPTAAGAGLRAAGRLLLAARVVRSHEIAQLLALLAQLTALADAVTRLRETQQRAAQAAAARAAAAGLQELQRRYLQPAGIGGSAGAGAAHRVPPATTAATAPGPGRR
jgi:hypothetical protein